ncbi:MAG: class I SAM-dependent methyltransferase [Candidatus Thorarchaeota archaeon]
MTGSFPKIIERIDLIADIPDGLKNSGAIAVREKLGTISGGEVLDVGTDDGDFINTLMKTLKNYKSFTGIDISEKEFDKAKERFKDAPVGFRVMNGETMEFQDNQFDTVCMSYTVHHLENIETVLAEMYRVLKPGGNFIIQEMYSDGEQSAAQLVDRDVHHLDAKVDTLMNIPHFETLTRQRLNNLINRIGLNELDIFESSWSVRCLFCDDAQKCEDPMNIVDFVLEQIDKTLDRIREHPSFGELNAEAESLKERAKATGSADASVMYFFGKK